MSRVFSHTNFKGKKSLSLLKKAPHIFCSVARATHTHGTEVMATTTVGFSVRALAKQPRAKLGRDSSSRRRGISTAALTNSGPTKLNDDNKNKNNKLSSLTAAHTVPKSAFVFSGGEICRRQMSRTIARASGDDEPKYDEEAEDEDEEENPAGGDRKVQDDIAAELKYQTKLYQAQQFLEEKKEEFIEQGEEGKAALEAEAKVARDRAGLELGLRASEIDDQLAEMLDETAAARARNEKVQAELAELEEQLTGTVSGRFRKAPPPKSPISSLKQEAIDKEAADVDARMRDTLEATQRKSAFTLIILLLVITDISMAAEGKWDTFVAIGAAIALVGYQAKNEYKNAEK